MSALPEYPNTLLEDEDGAPFPDEVQDAYQAQVIDFQIQLAALRARIAELEAANEQLRETVESAPTFAEKAWLETWEQKEAPSNVFHSVQEFRLARDIFNEGFRRLLAQHWNPRAAAALAK